MLTPTGSRGGRRSRRSRVSGRALTRAKEASILMADLLARTRNNTPPPSAALSSVRRLRHRHIIDRLDYLRGLRRLSVVMTQSDLARALGLTQPSISSALKSAAKVA